MATQQHPGPGLLTTMHDWWRENAARDGFPSTWKLFISTLWEFARESIPSRRRQRYGDVDYDWDFRVNTTAATVDWRDRLLGLFHSPYQPTEPALFHEMVASLMQTTRSRTNFDFSEFTFVDIGSGKGRALLMAADYPFRRILGIELLPELHRVAKENIGKYKSESQRCFSIDCVLGDAGEFVFPPEPIVLYLFNPLPEIGLARLISNLEHSLREHPRPVFILYHNPVLEKVLAGSVAFTKRLSTHQYLIFANEVDSSHEANAGDSDRRIDSPSHRDSQS